LERLFGEHHKLPFDRLDGSNWPQPCQTAHLYSASADYRSVFANFAVTSSITVRRSVSASRNRLWRECSTARGLMRWQADTVVGDATSGSILTLSWPAMGLSVRMHVAKSIPDKCVVYEVGSSRLTIEVDDGEIALTHDGLRSDDERDGMVSAWRTALGVLDHGLKCHPDMPRHVRWFMQPVQTTPEFAHVFFTDAAALAQWLTTSGGVPRDGENCRLTLAWGETLTGQVLANTVERDVALTWSEQSESCLVFRTFPSPRSPDERLLALAWSQYGSPAFSESSAQGLQASLDRLVRLLSRMGNA
jgi:uncharacterized protein YndB with AHSA1/START domain